mmetsp:Transcript_21522/g.40483  ORF Transcript_21522/g.40483 Transcript_21522/m.40483 type:complete len:153 (-) Transcript_21522:5294-5752(-)
MVSDMVAPLLVTLGISIFNLHFPIRKIRVAVRNSELISGNIAKKTIGDGSKTGLLYVLLRDCGPAFAASFMDRFAKLCSRYFGMHRGFSIGISDVSPSTKLKKLKFGILSDGYRKVNILAGHGKLFAFISSKDKLIPIDLSHSLRTLGGRCN